MQFARVEAGDERRLGEILSEPAAIRRVVSLGVRTTVECLDGMPNLAESALCHLPDGDSYTELMTEVERRGVRVRKPEVSEFWGQCVAEFALALTLCGLRRIPQLHHEILTSQDPWNYSPPDGIGRPGCRGQQFGDDPNFASGTIARKRVRVVGAGNIGSRYAKFCTMLGAEVATWDPFATYPGFHGAGARREYHLDQLVKDAEIFAPMVPLDDATRGLVTADHIDALPNGCLVVLVTRAAICDMEAVRRRVLTDEISLAADVWHIEPLPLDDPLLGRHNVVHTPHNAGRTIHANHRWAEILAAQFEPAS